MAWSGWAPYGLAAAVGFATALGSTSALAAPFKCGKVGGDFVFGQEANVNSLDQMTSSTIFPICVLASIKRCASLAEANGKTE